MKLLTAVAFVALLSSSEGGKSIGNLRRVLEVERGCRNEGEPCHESDYPCCEGYTCLATKGGDGDDPEELPSDDFMCVPNCLNNECYEQNHCCEGTVCAQVAPNYCECRMME
eukprot:CAMPEP_0197456254 /NCGR_PEP_ID=MMETSP1175-20131217/42873_1 /TAXON_ID=1003142 /ORGANISM="Triceratium dubium, Strain CCMP147" /LENGTH=111 /DNA_ID=CAMNT_0042990299 /DNA_START=14 /DNA_END=349 /DNA_ORIENTATION=+